MERNGIFAQSASIELRGRLGFINFCTQTKLMTPIDIRRVTLPPVINPDPTPSAPILPPTNNPSTMSDDDLVFTGVDCVPVVVH